MTPDVRVSESKKVTTPDTIIKFTFKSIIVIRQTKKNQISPTRTYQYCTNAIHSNN